MPNHIHTLQGKVRDARYLSDECLRDLNELVAYLSSSKFHTDPTVQVRDVLNRLEPLRSHLLDIFYLSGNDRARAYHFQD